MTVTNELPADQLLAKLFEVVLDEARSNRSFAEKLVGALPSEVVVRIEAGRKKPAKAATEPPVSLTRLFNREGEDALQAFLKKRTKAHLRDIVERQQIPVEQSVFDGDAGVVRQAIVDGVKSKIADRLAAAS
jgi:hypothetical protein